MHITVRNQNLNVSSFFFFFFFRINVIVKGRTENVQLFQRDYCRQTVGKNDWKKCSLFWPNCPSIKALSNTRESKEKGKLHMTWPHDVNRYFTRSLHLHACRQPVDACRAEYLHVRSEKSDRLLDFKFNVKAIFY